MVNEETIEAFEAATKLRAKAYAYFYEEIVKELNRDKAVELCGRVTYRLGIDKSSAVPLESMHSPIKVAQLFVADPVGKKAFDLDLVSGNDDEALIRMNRCPLVEMWQTMGLKNKEIKILCDFAHRIDYGTVEGAGCRLEFKSRIACGEESCILRIYK